MVPRYAPDIGGVERLVEGLARGLVARGLEVEIITTDPARRLSPVEALHGVTVRRFPTLANSDVYFISPRLGWWLLRNAARYALIHAHSYHTPLAFQAALASIAHNTPLVVSTYYHGTGHSPWRQLLHVPYRIPGRWLLHRAKDIITISQAERELLQSHFGQRLPVDVIPPGVDTCELTDRASETRPETGETVLLSVGRLHAYKQTSRLVASLVRLPPNYRAVLIGSGPERERIERIADMLDVSERVTIIPSLSRAELLDWYRRADVFVSLSRQESFGISLLEAALSGATVVASDIAAHRETLGYVPGDRAVLVNPDCTPLELAHAITTAPRHTAPSHLQEWNVPSWDHVVERTLRVYGEVTHSQTARARISTRRRQMKVLMATPRFAPFVGGVETHVDEVSRRLAARGVEVTIVTADPSGALPAEELRHGIRIRRVRSWPAVEDYYFAPGLLPVVTAGDWDLVHCQSYHTFMAPLAMLAAVARRRPLVVTFHSSGDGSALRRSGRGLQRAALRPLLSRANRLIAVSRFEAQFFSRQLNLPIERFAIIPNGSDLPPADLAPTIAPDPVVVSVGRLERYKGHHRVLAAFPRVLEEYPSARLRIIGSGPFEPKLRRMAADLGLGDRVQIGGIPSAQRQEMARQIGTASLVTLLSDYEAHPVAAMEALALGRQLLVADTSGLTELAEIGRVRTIPVDTAPTEVGDAIVSLVKQPLPEREVSLPTWDACADALLREYAAVLGREGAWLAS